MRVAKSTFNLAGIIACVGLILSSMPAEARTESDRSINLAGRQGMLIEQMTANSVLSAMGVDQPRKIGSVSSARALFARTLRGLRDGDQELGLSGTTRPEVLEALSRVEARWQDFDTVLQHIQTAGSVSDQDVRQLTNLNPGLLAATEDMVEAYVQYVYGGAGHSILSLTIDVSARQRMLSNRLLRQMSLIAYGYRANEQRRELVETMDLYNRALTGLIEGDTEMRLMAAPMPEIDAELAKVRRMWTQVLPMLESAAAGAPVGQEPMSQLARFCSRMVGSLSTAVLTYESL